jgi:Ca2+-binding EF-hand superfamily protein
MRNHINIRTTTLTAALSLVLAMPTFADSQYRSGQGTSPSMTQTQGGQAQADKFGSADADRDGKLSSSEYQALQQSLQYQTVAMISAVSAELINKKVQDVKGMDVLNQAGKKIGNVDVLVLSRNDYLVYAVISVGGFLGIGDTEITIPLDQLTWHENKLIAPTSASKKQLKAQQKYIDRFYDEIAVRELEDNRVIGQVITSGDQQMTQSFKELDANQDGLVDRAEFSAFESQAVAPSGSATEPDSSAPGKSY